MHLISVTLRDWKAYTSARFDFPVPNNGRNIVLIGAENGYGKTSLFEAIVLGLFGRDGMALIARSPFNGAGEERLATNYKTFLEKALHRGALTDGRFSCSVKLEFRDDRNEPLELQRVWYFNDSGVFRAADEDVQIFEGPTRKAVGPRNKYGQERLDWYRDYIAKSFLPYYLAAFFLFDGELVSQFADREMAAQVRVGIEGLLGIPVLRELAEDLRSYARQRRSAAPGGAGGNIAKLEEERDALKASLDERKSRYESLEPQIHSLNEERERLTRELASFGAGTQAQLQEQLTRLNTHRTEANNARDRLNEVLSGEFALALTGKLLRDATITQLRAEAVREEWESGKEQGSKNLDRFLTSLKGGLDNIKPALAPSQHEGVMVQAAESWAALWYPPPENSAAQVLHRHVKGLDRSKVIDFLEGVGSLSGPAIVEVLDTIASNEAAAVRLQQELSRTEAIGPQVDAKRDRLKTVNNQASAMERELGGLKNEIAALTGQLHTKNQEVARIGAQLDKAQPALRRASVADRVAGMVDELVDAAVPSQIAAIAAAMTDAHRAMAHKKDQVERIEITEGCGVRLLNSAGFDVRDLDLSAGEKQIFTQALISAVASVSGRVFPMIVDTPLGRLDVEHRKGVLRHLVSRGHQVILLSTNTEVVGEYLEEIERNILKKYRIKYEQVGVSGQSTPVEGYFENGSAP